MERPRILDGGLATELERRGHRLDDGLWSAGVFLRDPEAVAAVHRAYLDAGSEILIGASYQMSFDGLARAGLDRARAARVLRDTVAVARRACADRDVEARVAASIGPYGAILADGSEYRGDYGLAEAALERFHRARFESLAGAGADLLAIETIPSLAEARALCRLADAVDAADAWISFCCRDGGRLADGTPIARAAEMADRHRRIVAVGVNCTAPGNVASLIEEIRRATSKRIVVYPNSGERWDAEGGRWSGRPSRPGFASLVRDWASRGVWAIGGCCRVGPSEIAELAGILAA